MATIEATITCSCGKIAERVFVSMKSIVLGANCTERYTVRYRCFNPRCGKESIIHIEEHREIGICKA